MQFTSKIFIKKPLFAQKRAFCAKISTRKIYISCIFFQNLVFRRIFFN